MPNPKACGDCYPEGPPRVGEKATQNWTGCLEPMIIQTKTHREKTNKHICYWDQLAHRWNWQTRYVRIRRSVLITSHSFCILVLKEMYSTSPELCSCFARCCTLLWFVLVYFTHIFKVEPSDDGLTMRFSQCQWGVEVSISYEFKTYNLN